MREREREKSNVQKKTSESAKPITAQGVLPLILAQGLWNNWVFFCLSEGQAPNGSLKGIVLQQRRPAAWVLLGDLV